jgi:hypothetical protein
LSGSKLTSGGSTTSRQPPTEPSSPDPSTSDFDSPSFSSSGDTENDEVIGESVPGGFSLGGDSYDESAARAQANRIADRKLEKMLSKTENECLKEEGA